MIPLCYLSHYLLFTAKDKHIRGYTMNIDMDSGNSWRGVPLSEMYGSQSPWGAPEFPQVSPSYNHAVLYHVPSTGFVAGDRPPKPQIGQDKWDSEHVRMPCSSQSLYPVEDVSNIFFVLSNFLLYASYCYYYVIR